LFEGLGSCQWEAGCGVAGGRALAIEKAKVPKALCNVFKNAINTEDQEQFR